MNKEVQMNDIIDLMAEKLNNGGTVTFTPSGKSMLPMLRDGKDIVVLSKPQGRLHLFDIPLYRRDDGTYVLHRIVNFDSDGSYVLCGDNQFAKEHGVKDENIIGFVTAFFRKGKTYTTKSISYRFYINLWYYTYIFRRIYKYIRRKVTAIFPEGNKKQDEKNSEQ